VASDDVTTPVAELKSEPAEALLAFVAQSTLTAVLPG